VEQLGGDIIHDLKIFNLINLSVMLSFLENIFASLCDIISSASFLLNCCYCVW
jgi:hypothetical protein